jgi:hypothetical protein
MRMRAKDGHRTFAETKKRARNALLAEMFRERFERVAFAEAAEVQHHAFSCEFQRACGAAELKLLHASDPASLAD